MSEPERVPEPDGPTAEDPAPDDAVTGAPTAGAPTAGDAAPGDSGPGLPPPNGVESLVGALLEAGPEVAEHVVRAAQELLLAVQVIVDAADRAVQEQQRINAEAADPGVGPDADATPDPVADGPDAPYPDTDDPDTDDPDTDDRDADDRDASDPDAGGARAAVRHLDIAE